MAVRNLYNVTTQHSTWKPCDGNHVFCVTTAEQGRYASADGFGVSKTYACDSDETAIRMMCREHAATVVSIVAVPRPGEC